MKEVIYITMLVTQRKFNEEKTTSIYYAYDVCSSIKAEWWRLRLGILPIIKYNEMTPTAAITARAYPTKSYVCLFLLCVWVNFVEIAVQKATENI